MPIRCGRIKKKKKNPMARQPGSLFPLVKKWMARLILNYLIKDGCPDSLRPMVWFPLPEAVNSTSAWALRTDGILS